MAPEHGTLDENNTSLFFLLDNEYIEWKFNGNITNKYKKVVPEFLRTLVFARPRGDDQFADCTFSPSLDMSR